ncbi:MAG: 4-hydroxymandelate oxidase [Solirubrobacteraceae bacterium]|jgi:4-hydroxymandelate oxidase|nr:4-hydroxymandelate oxidase [Solirubrobacteraceae bacterium]
MTAAIDDTLISLADYERAAERTLAADAHSYLAGGAGDELTLADNLAAWRRLALRPRMLVGVGDRDASVSLLGRRRPHPIVVAPTAFQRLAHPDGELATARAAAATDTIMCLSTLATASPESVAGAAPGAPRWFQLYVFKDRGVSRDLVRRASEAGYEALVVTVDLPLFGIRERELRSGVRSSDAQAVTGAAAAGASGAMTPDEFGALVDPDLRWDDIARFAAESPLPVVVKGILTAADATLAADNGAAGVIVSNHGGRQLDGVLSGADALPEIVEVIGDRLDVLVDGGIRRGTDVVKALALGARAVLIGRPVVSGLAVGGAEGVQRVLEILLAELDNALGLIGAPRASALDTSFLAPAPWASR